MNTSLLKRVTYFMVLISLSGLVLLVFLRPTEKHVGINQYYRAKFIDLVEGKAYKPYVYRTLLPTTVRVISAAVPIRYRRACADIVEQYDITRKTFDILGWQTWAAFQYLLASVLMLLSFMGFGHYSAKLTEQLCELPETAKGRLLLVTGALMGLPPFFRYVSYPYDPPQLFLFTLALYLLTVRRTRAFFIAFVACCLNKETALLLIPLYGLASYRQYASPRQYWNTVVGLTIVYVGIKSALTWVFRSSPGSFVEFHFAHNVYWLTSGWSFTDLVVLSSIATLVLFRWSEKPILLRRSFLCVFLSLGSLAMFLGYIDEMRGYYEAYPLAFALAVPSLLRFNSALASDRQIAQQAGWGDAENRAPTP